MICNLQSCTTFSDLPLEILPNIFNEVILEEGDSAIGRLSGVCKDWCAILASEEFRTANRIAWVKSKLQLSVIRGVGGLNFRNTIR